MKFIIAGGTLFFILFFANVLMANDCHNRALKTAQDADGTSGDNRGPASTSTSGRVEKGMKDPDGNAISDYQATIANGRAAGIKAATGKDLTPQQATALLNDANAKNLLGDDYKYYLAEKSRPGGAAVLKAEESAKTLAEAAELKTKAAEETRARIEAERKRSESAAAKAKQDALDAEQRRKDELAWAESQKRAANPYMNNPELVTQPILKSSGGYDQINARMALSNHAPAGTLQALKAVEGVRGAMAEYERRIFYIEAALKKPGLAEVHKKALNDRLKTAKEQCTDLASVALKAGLNGPDFKAEVSSFVSRVCR